MNNTSPPLPPFPPRRDPSGRVLRLAVGFVLMGLLSGCATKRDVRDLRDQLTELHAQNQALLRELQNEQNDQEDAIADLAGSLQDGRAENARRFANVEDQLLTVQELTGIGQQQLAALRDQYEADRRQQVFGPPGGIGAGGFPGGGGFPGAVPGQSGGLATEIYEMGQENFRRGSYATARMAFEQVVSEFSADPLAPNAQYWIGETLAAEEDFEGALQAFLDVPAYNPTAEVVPDAYHRVGMMHLELGNTQDARRYFEIVVNSYPDSDPASLAERALRDL